MCGKINGSGLCSKSCSRSLPNLETEATLSSAVVSLMVPPLPFSQPPTPGVAMSHLSMEGASSQGLGLASVVWELDPWSIVSPRLLLERTQAFLLPTVFGLLHPCGPWSGLVPWKPTRKPCGELLPGVGSSGTPTDNCNFGSFFHTLLQRNLVYGKPHL